MLNYVRNVILVAESEQYTSNDLTRVLEDEDFYVIVANNTRSAIDVIACQPIDALVTNITTGEIDGIQIAGLARIMCPEIPIVFASAEMDIGENSISVLQDFEPPIATVVMPYAPNLIPRFVRRLLRDKTASISYSNFIPVCRQSMGSGKFTDRQSTLILPAKVMTLHWH